MQEKSIANIELISIIGYQYPKETSSKKCKYALYKCYCGNTFRAIVGNVKKGTTTSCGCFHKKVVSKNMSTHGLSNTRLYNTWGHITGRVENKNNSDFEYYGGRGITMSAEWRNDFMSFYNWAIQNGYEEDLTIDRINNDGNYEPDNCRWVTRTIQSRNTRKIMAINKSGYRGVSWSKKDKKWRTQITINNKTKCIGHFTTALESAKAYDKYVIENNLEHTKNFT